MTTQEALKLAKQYGWTVTKTPAAPAQRKTLVEGANTAGRNTPQRTANPHIYRNGDYLREKLKSADWHQLADRSCPLPDGISPKHLIKEFSDLLAGIIEMNYN
jgi:hypothetical protein